MSLLEEFLTDDIETSWTGNDIFETGRRDPIVERLASRVLSRIHAAFSDELTSCFIAITGLDPGYFTPIATLGRTLEKITQISQFQPNSLLSQIINSDPTASESLILEPHRNFVGLYKSNEHCKEKFTIFLREHGELFGMASFNSKIDRGFSKSFIKELQDIHALLNQRFAETIFSARLWSISRNARSFTGVEAEHVVVQKVLLSTLKSFAASGVVLRLWDNQTSTLPVSYSASAEDETSGPIISNFLSASGSPAEQVSQIVFVEKIRNWLVVTDTAKGLRQEGTHCPEALIQNILSSGIRSFFVFPLDVSDGQRIGTLSVFHTFLRNYSWRDLALASVAGQKVSDSILLLRSQSELTDKNTNLELAKKNLEQEHALVTGAEITSLLSHDLGHKLIAVRNSYERCEEDAKKAIKNRKSFDSIKMSFDSLRGDIDTVSRTMSSINAVFSSYNSHNGGTSRFSVINAVESVFFTLRDAMNRANMQHSFTGSDKITMQGNHQIFELVIFNLLVNAIQAQRQSKSSRRNTVYVKVAQHDIGNQAQIVELDFWDQGPGIDRNLFPNPQDIFVLGTSSKGGTGRGLAVSRNLLNVFFAADMKLFDPATAYFRITVKEPK